MTVQDPVVAIANCSAAQRGKVRAGARLGEELAGDRVRAQQRRNHGRAEFFAAVGLDRGRDKTEGDRKDLRGLGRLKRFLLRAECTLVGGGESATPVLHGPCARAMAASSLTSLS